MTAPPELNLMAALARASGFLKGIGHDGPVLDDDPMDCLRRIRAAARDEADKANAALDEWHRRQQGNQR